MNNKKYYLAINSILLSNYIGHGIILPRKYLEEKIVDIQSKFNEQLFLTEKKWITGEYSNDCSLEIVLTPAEIKALQVFEDYVLLNDALPISRIKRIFFKSEKIRMQAIYNIEQGDGFIPPDVVEIDTIDDTIEINLIGKSKINIDDDISIKIKCYNQLLGGFTCMKLAGKLTNEYNSNYSENYFATLGAINTVIKAETKIANISIKSNIVNVFITSEESNWDKEFLDVLKSDPKSEDEFAHKVEKYAKNHQNAELLSSLKGSLGVKWNLLKESDSFSIALALLHRYGYGKRKNTTDLFNDMLSGKMPFIKKIESLLFLYGFHYGYSQFRNKEIINNNTECVKYLMNSHLDYYTIESVFQKTFRNKIDSDDFEYLTSWCPMYADDNKNSSYIIDVPINGLRTEQMGLIQKLKEKFLSFFLEGEQSKYSEKVYTMMKEERSNKLDLLFSELYNIEYENNNVKQQLSIYKNELERVKMQISDIEIENSILMQRIEQKSIEIEKLNVQLDSNEIEQKKLDVEKKKECLKTNMLDECSNLTLLDTKDENVNSSINIIEKKSLTSTVPVEITPLPTSQNSNVEANTYSNNIIKKESSVSEDSHELLNISISQSLNDKSLKNLNKKNEEDGLLFELPEQIVIIPPLQNIKGKSEKSISKKTPKNSGINKISNSNLKENTKKVSNTLNPQELIEVKPSKHC